MGRGSGLLRTVLCLWAFGSAVCCSSPLPAQRFQQWKAEHGLSYASPVEEAHRLHCFAKTLESIERASAANPHARFATNRFSDLCYEEFAERFLGAVPPDRASFGRLAAAPTPSEVHRILREVGGEFDWRDKGAVTPAKDQASCGSCWAFSAVGNMEGQWFLETGQLISLSEQQLVSCSQRDSGCQGGWPSRGIAHVIENGGITSEDNYTYVSGQGTVPKCDKKKSSKIVAKFEDWQAFPRLDEESLAASLVTVGPLSVSVHADDVFRNYAGGVITSWKPTDPDTNVNHAILLVAFGEEDGVPFWTIKNSWGPLWGEKGYIRIKRGENLFFVTEFTSTALTKSNAQGICNEDCGADSECCYGSCCEKSADYKCCPGGRYDAHDTCCNSSSFCCSGHQDGLGGGCCPSAEQCCGTWGCCADGGVCSNGECCPADNVCGDGCCDKTQCCGRGTDHAMCIVSSYVGTCCPDGHGCTTPEICCGDGCCDSGFSCVNDQCVCPEELQCGNLCCNNGTKCCLSEDGKKSKCMNYPDDICCPSGQVCGGVLVCCGDNCCFPDQKDVFPHTL